MKILLVEDDQAIVEVLGALLASEGYQVDVCSRQDAAIARIGECAYDLLLLDVTLRQGTGFAVCAAAQKMQPTIPVIFLTASDDEFSTVAGLEMGAADYIAKPFRARELLSRIKAALRSRQGADVVLSLGNVTLQPSSAVVKKSGQELFLSALEYKLLLYFMQNKGNLVTRDALRDAIWDAAGEYVADNAVSVYVKRLREKIEDDPATPRFIQTVRGLGYKALD